MAASLPNEPLEDATRRRVLGVLRRFGWNATSFQILEPGFEYWFYGADACVAYVDTGRAWVAAGAPIADAERLTEVALAFAQAAKDRGRRVLFFATEHRFVDTSGFCSTLIGEQPLWDPAAWNRTLEGAASLREQLRRARAKGVTVARLEPGALADPNGAERRELAALIERWSGSKPMPPMGFLVRVYPYSFLEERSLFVARKGGELVGFAGVVPVYARNGRFIEDLVRAPNAPNGTSELLVDAAMRDAAAAGSGYVTLGLAPLAGAVPFGLRLVGRWGASLYDFEGLKSFKAKLRPREWTPIYLSYPNERSLHAAVYDSLSAFSQRGLLRYGIDAVFRGPAIVVRALALLLVPWTCLLATVSPRWFPAAWVQWFWVVFDVLVAGGLLALSARWRPWLAALLLGLVGADALATLSEAADFVATRRPTLLEYVVVVIAISGPLIASVVLWNARRRTLRAAHG
ncbi:MAG TPA: DUF2156 domain-containing protein [Polyangiaceae bacterium]|nr:DUF2156 domain-containing protein [Polyangiaceae bacterium]